MAVKVGGVLGSSGMSSWEYECECGCGTYLCPAGLGLGFGCLASFPVMDDGVEREWRGLIFERSSSMMLGVERVWRGLIFECSSSMMLGVERVGVDGWMDDWNCKGCFGYVHRSHSLSLPFSSLEYVVSDSIQRSVRAACAAIVLDAFFLISFAAMMALLAESFDNS